MSFVSGFKQSYKIAAKDALKNQGCHHSIALSWLYKMRAARQQGKQFQVLEWNLRQNPDLQTYLLNELRRGYAGGPRVSPDEVIQFVTNPADMAAEMRLKQRVYWD